MRVSPRSSGLFRPLHLRPAKQNRVHDPERYWRRMIFWRFGMMYSQRLRAWAWAWMAFAGCSLPCSRDRRHEKQRMLQNCSLPRAGQGRRPPLGRSCGPRRTREHGSPASRQGFRRIWRGSVLFVYLLPLRQLQNLGLQWMLQNCSLPRAGQGRRPPLGRSCGPRRTREHGSPASRQGFRRIWRGSVLFVYLLPLRQLQNLGLQWMLQNCSLPRAGPGRRPPLGRSCGPRRTREHGSPVCRQGFRRIGRGFVPFVYLVALRQLQNFGLQKRPFPSPISGCRKRL